MAYYNQLVPIRTLEDNYNHEFDNYKQVAAKILDPSVLRNKKMAMEKFTRDMIILL